MVDDIVHEFVAESHENLDRMAADLLALELDPTSVETVHSIFRALHTVKGTCGFLGFTKLEAIAHAGEDLLSAIRDRSVPMTAEAASTLFETSDAMREVLRSIERHSSEGPGDYTALVARLEALAATVSERRDSADDVERLVRVAGVTAAGKSAAPDETTVRVDLKLLDALLDISGQLVLTRNQIVQQAEARDDDELLAAAKRLDGITAALHESVSRTRTQPIGSHWTSFHRLVRDLGVACNKQVELEIDGHETELDRALIEAIKDPLTHLIRNAVDHGIESPAQRTAAGKTAAGHVTIRAFHKGGHVHLEISDDGRGIDIGEVRRLAVGRGVLTAAESHALSDHDVASLIFLPGVSTADSVTSVSGRGVGMDVVKTNIDRVGGTVHVWSQQGVGTTFSIRIPLTLAIMPALIVSSGPDQYAIPQTALLEVARLDASNPHTPIELVDGVPACRLHGRTLPLVDLGQELGAGGGHLLETLSSGRPLDVVALHTGDRPFALVVDAVRNTEEIVVTPMGGVLAELSLFAGASILGDGAVALILDVAGLALQAGVPAATRVAADEAISETNGSDPTDGGHDAQRLLVMGVGRGRRIAVPFERIERVEEFSPGLVERAGERELVQFQGDPVPLARLSTFLGVEPVRSAQDPMPVVLTKVDMQTIGLVVDEIVDVVDAPPDDGTRAAGPMTRSILGRPTTVVDLDRVAESINDLEDVMSA